MSLRIRRGTNSQRTGVTLDLGEIAYTTDTKKLYVGDGITAGGINVIKESVGAGLEWNNTLQQIEYTGALGSALQNIVEDTSPELGGNLSLNNRTINGIGAIDITGNITATGLSLATGLLTDLSLNSNDIIGPGAINITGNITATGNINGGNVITNGTISATIGLGEDLPLNTHDINGTGNINITGNISSTGVLTASGLTSTLENFEINHATPGLSATLIRNLPAAANHTKVNSVTVGNYATGMTVSVSRNSLDNPQATQVGDALYSEIIAGHDGTSYQYSSALVHIVDPYGTVATNAVPGAVGLVAWNSTNILDVSKSMWLNSAGRVSINKGPMVAIEATLDINGFAKLAVLTVEPTAPANGMVAIADGTLWDPASTGKSVMVVYLGGAWCVAATAL